MKPLSKFRAPLLCAALAAVAAPAFAADVVEIVQVPASSYRYGQPATTYYYVERPVTTYVYTEPLATEVYRAPDVVVTAPALTEDEAITRDVVDTIASNPRISGRIGVETRDNNVNLSGIVGTPGQARSAVRDAQSVPGVRNVESELKSRVGGSY